MNLREQIMNDVKSAMKSKEQEKLDTLRFLQAAIKNREIDLRPNPINEEEIVGVIKKLVKQRKESIEQYEAAARADLANKEKTELSILESYLPQQMGEAQLAKIVDEVIAALNAKTAKEMGTVMKEVIARTAGTADNKMISSLVKSKLQ